MEAVTVVTNSHWRRDLRCRVHILTAEKADVLAFRAAQQYLSAP